MEQTIQPITNHEHINNIINHPVVGARDTLQTYREELNDIPTRIKRRNRRQSIVLKPNRPKETRWMQQKLPSWQPMINGKNVIVAFYLIAIICLALGGFMLHTMLMVKEYIIDYTDCPSIIDPNENCSNRWELELSSCRCSVPFQLEEKLPGPVFLYYGLDGFFQNHRRYVASVDRYQLLGQDRSLQEIRSNCYPFSDVDGKIIAPCGAIANSMFTDKFEMILVNKNYNQTRKIDIQEEGISWPFDRFNLYKNPSDINQLRKYHKPINWSMTILELDPTNQINNGYQNEHFMVWMRTAAFSSFRKLWGRIDTGSLPYSLSSDQQSLPPGLYNLIVDYEFRTVFKDLRINKKIIISNMSWMGGRNLFLPIIYLVFGTILLITGTVFIFLFRMNNKNPNLEEIIPARGHIVMKRRQTTTTTTQPSHPQQYQSTSQTIISIAETQKQQQQLQQIESNAGTSTSQPIDDSLPCHTRL